MVPKPHAKLDAILLARESPLEEPARMYRKLLKSKLHRAIVTRSDLHYEGSIAVDETVLEAADILPHEAVQVWNLNNGARLETYAIPAPAGSGEICLNGAAARLAMPGDLVILATFQWLKDDKLAGYQPKIVFVDSQNRVIENATEHVTEPVKARR